MLFGLLLEVNLQYEDERTERSRRAAAALVPPEVRLFTKGEELALPDDLVTRERWLELLAESRAWLSAPEARREVWLRFGGFFLLAVGLLLLCRYFRAFAGFPPPLGEGRERERLGAGAGEPEPSFRAGFVLLLLALAVLLGAKLSLLYALGLPELAPVALPAFLTTLARGRRAGLALALVLSGWVALLAGADFALALGLVAGALSAVLMASRIHTRRDVLLAGLVCGAAHAGASLAAGVALGAASSAVLLRAGCGLANGLAVGLFLSATLPLWESALRLSTEISLLEWSNLNHPVLRELARRAPGTYQHSLRVGILAEAAANAIGASPLLARVGSYYHDLGKVPRPEYYVENEAGAAAAAAAAAATAPAPGAAPGESLAASRHERLAPELSALIVRAHVKDGVVLAATLGLPRVLQQLIEQHHGTTLIRYFHARALERAKARRARLRLPPASGSPPSLGEGRERVPAGASFRVSSVSPDGVDEEFFRYPGPRPRTREAAILLLADQVEAATRALRDPVPMQLRNLVHEIAFARLTEGQFSECGLTLQELEQVEEAISRELLSMFHPRREYPASAPPPAASARPSAPPGAPPAGSAEQTTGQ